MKLDCGPGSETGLADLGSKSDARASRAWSLGGPPIEPTSIPGLRSARSPASDRVDPANSGDLSAIVSEFTSAWEKSHSSLLGSYLDRLDPADSRGAVELIYLEFCLAEAAGQNPELSVYLSRYPRYAETLERLLGLHNACSPSLLGSAWSSLVPAIWNCPMPATRSARISCAANWGEAASRVSFWPSRSTSKTGCW